MTVYDLAEAVERLHPEFVPVVLSRRTSPVTLGRSWVVTLVTPDMVEVKVWAHVYATRPGSPTAELRVVERTVVMTSRAWLAGRYWPELTDDEIDAELARDGLLIVRVRVGVFGAPAVLKLESLEELRR